MLLAQKEEENNRGRHDRGLVCTGSEPGLVVCSHSVILIGHFVCPRALAAGLVCNERFMGQDGIKSVTVLKLETDCGRCLAESKWIADLLNWTLFQQNNLKS